jgi:uracil-DNA glycosylase family 4
MDDIQKQILELARKTNVPDPVHYVDYAVEELAKDKINEIIKTCDCCEECCGGTKSIVGGNPHGSILMIGEYVLEEQNGSEAVIPFEGTPEGQMIHSVLNSLHVNEEQLIWMNVVNCYTHKVVNGKSLKRAPKTSEQETCQLYIDYAINSFKPLYIVLLGNIAMNVFKKGVVKQERGKWFYIRDSIKAMPTYSPTYIRQMEEIGDEFVEDYRKEFQEDLSKVFKEAQKEYPESDILLA